MTREIWVNAGWGNGLLSDDTKRLPEAMLSYNKSAHALNSLHELKITFEIWYLRGANDLTVR